MIRVTSLILGGLLWASLSHAVSRIGGGTLWNEAEGFSTTLPAKFESAEIFSDNGVRLRGPILLDPRGHLAQPQLINLYLLRTSFPELSKMNDRSEFDHYFFARGWHPTATSVECLEVFKNQNRSATTIAVGWGDGHGLVLVGANTLDILNGMGELVKALQLYPGACEWK